MILDKVDYTVLCVFLILAGAVDAQAQTPRSISGSFAQFFIGRLVPIPNPSFGSFHFGGFTGAAPTFVNTPIGGVKPTPYAFAVTSNAGATVWVPPYRITHSAPTGRNQLGTIYLLRSLGPFVRVLQVYTNLSVDFPRAGASAVFQPSGRTGADVISWCPGLTATVLTGGNPGCSQPSQAPVVTLPACTSLTQCPHSTQTLMTQVPGGVRYNRTAGQLGGAARGNLGGSFHVAVEFFGAPPGSPATIYFLGGDAPRNPAIGGAFGAYNQHGMPSLPGIIVSSFTSDGRIAGMTLSTFTPGVPQANHTVASFGAPFTAGQIVLSVTANLGPDQVFTLTGSDERTPGGAGNVTLVGGAVSLRQVTNLDANRGILHLALPEPSAVAGTLAALLALLFSHRLVHRRSRRG